MTRTIFDLALDRISEAQKEIDDMKDEVLSIKWYQLWKMIKVQDKFREAVMKLERAKREYHRLWH